MFAEISAPVNEEADSIFKAVQEKWVQTGPRWLGLIKTIKPLGRVLLPWIKFWQEVSVLLNGGTFYRLAKQWSEFEMRLDRYKKAEGKYKEFEEALFQLYVFSFQELEDIQKYVEIAAGLKTGKVSAEKAKEILDQLLDEYEVREFDQELRLLENEIVLLEMDNFQRDMYEALGKPYEAISREDKITIIKQLRITPLGMYWSLGLERLENHWKEQDWEKCKKLLHDLRLMVRSPSDFEAGAMLIRALKLPKRTRGLIRFFLPAFTLLDDWQAAYGHALFLESEYYLALSKYRSFSRARLNEAMERAFLLLDRFLGEQAPSDMDVQRHADLSLLARCLVASSALRLLLEKQPDPQQSSYQAEVRLSEIEKEHLSELNKATDNARLDPDVRATTLNTLGLLARHRRTQSQSEDENPNLAAELGYFSRSLDLKRAPDTCFYLAESLIDLGDANQARRYLQEALKLCPRHAGALSLQGILETTGRAAVVS